MNADGDQHMGGVDEDAEGEQGVSLSFSSLSRGSGWVVVRLLRECGGCGSDGDVWDEGRARSEGVVRAQRAGQCVAEDVRWIFFRIPQYVQLRWSHSSPASRTSAPRRLGCLLHDCNDRTT